MPSQHHVHTAELEIIPCRHLYSVVLHDRLYIEREFDVGGGHRVSNIHKTDDRREAMLKELLRVCDTLVRTENVPPDYAARIVADILKKYTV